MPTNGTPPSTWKTEPVTLYSVNYYSNNAVNTIPTIIDPILYDRNSAEDRAKALILANGSTGVCTITPNTSVIVYPPIPWQDF